MVAAILGLTNPPLPAIREQAAPTARPAQGNPPGNPDTSEQFRNEIASRYEAPYNPWPRED